MGICTTISQEDRDITNIINIVSASLSAIGSAATILSFLVTTIHKDRQARQQLYNLIFWLSVADFFASFGIVVSQGIIFAHPSAYEDNYGLCVVFRVIIQYFFLCSFVWTTMIAIYLFRAANHMPEKLGYYIAFHVFSWGLPAILIIVALVGNFFQKNVFTKWCDLKMGAEWGLWFAPMIISVVINIIFYFLILRSLHHRFKHSERSTTSNTFLKRRKLENDAVRKISFYLLAFVICWIWDIIGHVITSVNPHCKVYFLFILQVLFAPLQGSLNFIVYGLSNQLLQRCFAWKRSTQQLQRTNVLNTETPRPQSSYGFAIGIPKKGENSLNANSVSNDYINETTPLTSTLEPSTP